MEVPVFYVTSEGQTARIAERIVSILRERGLESASVNLRSEDAKPPSWERVKGAVLGASLHYTRYQREARRFVRHHRDELASRPSMFFSVSLSAASEQKSEVEAALGLAKKFCDRTGWQPDQLESFAGALAYTQYGWLTRFFMKRIAAAEGGPTDTSRDHELTDWSDVERAANEFADRVLGVGRAGGQGEAELTRSR